MTIPCSIPEADTKGREHSPIKGALGRLAKLNSLIAEFPVRSALETLHRSALPIRHMRESRRRRAQSVCRSAFPQERAAPSWRRQFLVLRVGPMAWLQ